MMREIYQELSFIKPLGFYPQISFSTWRFNFVLNVIYSHQEFPLTGLLLYSSVSEPLSGDLVSERANHAPAVTIHQHSYRDSEMLYACIVHYVERVSWRVQFVKVNRSLNVKINALRSLQLDCNGEVLFKR